MKIDEVLAELQVSSAPVPVDGSVMAKAREVMMKQRTERVLNVVTQELELSEKCKAVQLQAVRRLRLQLEAQLKALKNLTRASDYAEQTGNFLPLAFAMGGVRAVSQICDKLNVEHVDVKNPLLKVPEDWSKPKS